MNEPAPVSTAMVPIIFTHFPLPYRNPGTRFERVYPEGKMLIESRSGVPYGKSGRSLVSLITTQAVLQGSRKIELGHVTEAFRRMGQVVSGGKLGTVQRISDQFQRFYTTIISLELRIDKGEGFRAFRGKQMLLAEEMELYWSAKEKDLAAPGLFQNTVTLSQPYFDYVQDHSTPVDLITFHSLQSPLDQDWYAWLSRKLFVALKSDKESLVPWESLYLQFGLKDPRRKGAEFRKDFADFMVFILTKHPEARVKLREDGVSIIPSTLIIPEDHKGFVQT